jgi:hypothetical protein
MQQAARPENSCKSSDERRPILIRERVEQPTVDHRVELLSQLVQLKGVPDDEMSSKSSLNGFGLRSLNGYPRFYPRTFRRRLRHVVPVPAVRSFVHSGPSTLLAINRNRVPRNPANSSAEEVEGLILLAFEYPLYPSVPWPPRRRASVASAIGEARRIGSQKDEVGSSSAPKFHRPYPSSSPSSSCIRSTVAWPRHCP